jgi:hypothetical protein
MTFSGPKPSVHRLPGPGIPGYKSLTFSQLLMFTIWGFHAFHLLLGLPGPRLPGPRLPCPRLPGPRLPGPRLPGPRLPGPGIPGYKSLTFSQLLMFTIWGFHAFALLLGSDLPGPRLPGWRL